MWNMVWGKGLGRLEVVIVEFGRFSVLMMSFR